MLQTIIYAETPAEVGVFITLDGDLTNQAWCREIKQAGNLAQLAEIVTTAAELPANALIKDKLRSLHEYISPSGVSARPPDISQVSVTVRNKW